MKLASSRYHSQAFFQCPLFIFLFFTGVISFQEAKAQVVNEEVVTTSRAPAALNLTAIPEFSQLTNQLIRETEELLMNRTELSTLEQNLEDIQPRLDAKLTALKDTTVIFRIDKLDAEEREMNLLSQRIDQRDKSLAEMIDAAAGQTDLLSFQTSTWTLTQDSLASMISALKEPEETSESKRRRDKEEREEEERKRTTISRLEGHFATTQSHIEELAVISGELDMYTERLNVAQAEVLLAISKLQNVNAAIKTEKKELRGKIFLPGYPPIWRMERESSGITSPMIWDRVDRNVSIIRDYMESNRQLPYYILFVFLLIFGILIYLRFKGDKYLTTLWEELANARILLKYPFISAMLITMLWAILFADTPQELNRYVWPILIIPVTVLLRNMNPSWPRSELAAFVIFYLTFFSIPMFNEFPYSQRIFLLIVNGGLLVYILWFRKKYGEDPELNKWWFGMIPTLTNLFLFGVIVAFIANVVGILQLAQLVTNTILGTFLGFMVLRVLIELTASLLMLILVPLHGTSNILQEDGRQVMQHIRRIVTIIGLIFWVIGILDLLTIRKPVMTAIVDFFTFKIIIGEVGFSLWNVVAFFIIIWVASRLSYLIRYVLDMEIYPRLSMQPGMPGTISIMIRFTMVLLGGLMALAAVGIKISDISIAIGALGVGIGFGLRDVINNFISGVILAIERPISIGDIIQIGDKFGTVKDIGLRASVIKTWDGADVNVPNGELVASRVTNWTRTDRRRRITVDVRVPFDTDIEAVSELLINTAATVDGVMKKPSPYLHFQGIGDSYMEIQVFAWIRDITEIFEMGTLIRKEVYAALQKAGYEIPIKKISVDMKGENGEEKGSV